MLANLSVLTLSGVQTGILETLHFGITLGGLRVQTGILEGELRLVIGGVAGIGLFASNLS